MSDLSLSDVQHAVQDATNDLRDHMARLGDTLQRIEQGSTSGGQQDFDYMRDRIEDTNRRVQVIEDTLQQMATYLQSVDEVLRTKFKDVPRR